MDNTTTHNGWTNYATWRVNLEMFDGYDQEDKNIEAYDLGLQLKEQAEEVITQYGELPADSLAVSYANAFMQDVDWTEIAVAILDV